MVWDSHPLSLGATPKQVYVDGIAQLENPEVSTKPASFQILPATPNFNREAAAAIKYDGLAPLTSRKSHRVMFTRVNSIFTRNGEDIDVLDHAGVESNWSTVVIEDGVIVCTGQGLDCRDLLDHNVDIINLEGGSLAPGLTTYGSPIGLVEMRLEPSTNDGLVFDPLEKDIPSIFGELPVIRAIDGLQFGGRNTL